MNNLLKQVPESIRLTIKSSLPLIIVIILFLVAGNFGISKILDIRSKIADGQNSVNILKEKLNVLQTITAEVSSGSGISVAALPDANPSLVVVSQIRSVASQLGLTVANIKTSGEIPDESGLSRVDISFEVTGAKPQVLAFLDAVEKIAPITLINKVKIGEAAGSARAETSVKSYWAGLPKTLPTLTQAISGLTSAEKTVLGNISGLSQPVFVDVPPSDVPGNPAPFGE